MEANLGDVFVQGRNVSDVQAVLDVSIPVVRDLNLAELTTLFHHLIPPEQRPAGSFLDSLDDEPRRSALLACVLVYLLSRGKVVPRVFQLEAVLGSLSGRDGIIASGTGSGKTLIMVILLLLRPKELAILIVPLKRLQQAQLEAFQSYGISTVIINEDTPDDPVLWKDIANSRYTNIITTMEQLGIFDGHMTKFAKLLRKPGRKFVGSIKRIQIDELQTIYTAGVARHGHPAFRPAYGRLDAIRLLFPKNTTLLGFSATLPPHILRVAKKKMSISANHFFVNRTSNRPNIMYATHQIVGSASDFRNLGLVIPPASSLTSPSQIPLTIIFHDDIKECSDASLYLDGLLPLEHRGIGLVRHYHSHMSKDYLESTYQAFQNGTCRILHTCSGMESGIDFNRADIVIQYGIASDETKTIQRGGRGGRNPSDRSLFLILYESWVKDLDISQMSPSDLREDPDRPFLIDTKKYPTKSARTSIHCIQTIQSSVCIRQIFANYLHDDTPEAIDYVTQFCCDRHDDGFSLAAFVSGGIYTGLEPKAKKAAGPREKRRPVKERGPLEKLLRTWRSEVWRKDSLRALRSPTWILDEAKIKTLAGIHPSHIQGPSDITRVLGGTEEWSAEWAGSIFDVLREYLPAPDPAPLDVSRKRKDAPSPIPSTQTPSSYPRLTIKIPGKLALRDQLNIPSKTRIVKHTTKK